MVDTVLDAPVDALGDAVEVQLAVDALDVALDVGRDELGAALGRGREVLYVALPGVEGWLVVWTGDDDMTYGLGLGSMVRNLEGSREKRGGGGAVGGWRVRLVRLW